MDEGKKQAFFSGLRSLLIALGGWAAGQGYLTQGGAESIVNIVMIVGPMLWGMVAGYRKEKA